jgi:hypothetical protein
MGRPEKTTLFKPMTIKYNHNKIIKKHKYNWIISNIKKKYKAVHSIENDSDSVILLLGSAQIPSTAQWEITPIVQCQNSYRAVKHKYNCLVKKYQIKTRKKVLINFTLWPEECAYNQRCFFYLHSSVGIQENIRQYTVLKMILIQ